jgi:hypothetical protein
MKIESMYILHEIFGVSEDDSKPADIKGIMQSIFLYLETMDIRMDRVLDGVKRVRRELGQ